MLVAAALGAALRLPPVVRFVFTTVGSVSGATLVLRDLVAGAAVADAGVAALAASGLSLAAVARHRSDWAAPADVLGHLASYAALGLAVAEGSRTALVAALAAVAVVHGIGAWAADAGRPTLPASGRGAAALAVAQGSVAAAALPVLAIVAADAFTWVSQERPRAGLVLSAVAWVYVLGLWSIRTDRLRRIMVIGVWAVAASGISVAAPSLTASVIAVWSAAAVTGLVAVLDRSPIRSAPAWMLGVVAVVLSAARAGIAGADLHFIGFGIGAVLSLVPPILGRTDRMASRWLHAPVALGLLLMPVGIGFAIGDRRFLAILALTAAAVYVIMGLLLRFGGFSLPAAAMVGVAHAHLVEAWANPFEYPLVWMPLAALFAVGAMLFRGRSFSRGDPGFGLVAAWWATAGLATVFGIGHGQLDWILLIDAALLSCYGLASRSVVFWYLGLVLWGIAGVLFGTGWLSLVLLGIAGAVGIHAWMRGDRIAELALAPGSVVLAAGSYSALGVWLSWTAGEAIGIGLPVAVALTASASAASLAPLAPKPRMWVAPALSVAQGGMLVVASIGLFRVGGADVSWSWAGFSPEEAWLAIAATLVVESALVGIVGTIRRLDRWPWASAALAAGAIGCALASADPSIGSLVPLLTLAGGVCAAIGSGMWFGGARARLALWVWPLHAIGQLGLAVAAVAAVMRLGGAEVPWSWESLPLSDARLELAVVLGLEAVLAGSAATVKMLREAAWVSVALSAGAIAMVGSWSRWDATEVLAISASAGALVAAAAAVLWLRTPRRRAALWVGPSQVLGQLGLVVGFVTALGRLGEPADASGWVGLSVLAAKLAAAAVLTFESVLLGAAATVRRLADWAWGSALLTAGAVSLVLAALAPTPGELMVILTAGGAALAAVTAALWPLELPDRSSMWVAPIHGLGQLGLLAALGGAVMRLSASDAGGWAGLSIGEAQLVIIAVLGFEAVLIGVVGTMRRDHVAPWVSAVLAGGAYAMVGVRAGWETDAVFTASVIPGILAAGLSAGGFLGRISGRASLWIGPVHAVGQAGLVTAGAAAALSFAGNAAAGYWAALLALEAAGVLMAAPLLPAEWRAGDAAGVLATGAALCAVGIGTTETSRGALLQVIALAAGLAAFAAPGLQEHRRDLRSSAWIFALGTMVGAALLAVSLIGPVSGALDGVLALGGAGLVAAGLRSGYWPISYGGLVLVLAAALLAGREALGGNRHAYAVAIAVVLLIILDMERIRVHRMEHPDPAPQLEALRIAEFVTVGIPLVMAAVDALGELSYAGLLAAESVVVVIWAIASQVRRRLLIGSLALVASILIPAVILAVEAGSGGITAGSALAIGAGVAVILIVIGSLLERGRARVGRAVARVSEILEEWE
jgi:hypothetical protein